jgi:predicted ArsR family transcriptional regulator
MAGAGVDHILKSSRSAIIELLKDNGAMSVDGLARSMGISKVCVRRHLSLLESDGLVIYEEQRHERGRPRYIYRLTAKAQRLFPQQYDELAIDVLGIVARRHGPEALEEILADRADELVDHLSAELAGLEFEERVRGLARVMSGRGFLAESRRLRDGSYRMRQRHCPTESVAVKYPSICEQELRVYRESLGCEVVRECRIADGDRVCEFRIHPPVTLRATGSESHPASSQSGHRTGTGKEQKQELEVTPDR